MPRSLLMRVDEGRILHVECHESMPSTLALARIYAREGYSDGYIVFSESQTDFDALGRPLEVGESERGVFLSCILRPSIFPSQAGFIGAMSAVALACALEGQTEKPVGIGWVSDVFCDGKKIGTTSIEGKLDSFMAYEYIIVSFAVKITEEDFPPRLSNLIKKVFVSENTSTSLIIAKDILSKFFELYPKRVKSPDKFMDAYKRKFILGGEKAKYIDGGKKKRCKILGVDSADGRLLIETKSGDILHISGIRNIILPEKIKIKTKKRGLSHSGRAK